jgi:muramoyltetrapeptide carboxypeptidase
MKRKQFLGSVFSGSISQGFLPGTWIDEENEVTHTIPAYLRPGDIVAITSPAGFITAEGIRPAVRLLESWGFRIRVGETIGRRDLSFGGTDEERRKDMQAMLDDPSVRAILCARGGYGITRIIDQLDLSRLKEKPKWIIGFSDITALHLQLSRSHRIASLHSKMCNSFPDDWAAADPVVQGSILSIQKALTGEQMRYSAPPDDHDRYGTATGILVGGNLSMILNVMSTRSEIRTDGCILFLEEVGEYLYSLDRMFVQLKRAGKLDRLAGLIIGGFNKIRPDDPGEEFGRTFYDIVHEKISGYSYPVCFNFPVGHQKNNFALKCGVRHCLTVHAEGVQLVEVRK